MTSQENPQESGDLDAREALAQLEELLKLNISNIEPVSQDPAEICPHLYLGSMHHARDRQMLVSLGITHVLNCAAESVKTGQQYYQQSGVNHYKEFAAEDCKDYDVMQHFEEMLNFVNEAKAQGGKVFIHCEAGVNRSGSLCIAYAMVDQKMPLLASAMHCKERRGRICTNKAFQFQLFQYARAHGLPLC